MAKTKVEMYGTGNFVIGKTLYAFRETSKIATVDGEKVSVPVYEQVEAQEENHVEILKAESARRRQNVEKTQRINEKDKV